MTRRLREFKIEGGASMIKHPDAFGELTVCLKTLGGGGSTKRDRDVVLLSRLPSEYELIASIPENAKDITLNNMKEKLL
ncbi:hypothetical protein PR002_g14782 [Phytophthora rubi]|uniref:Uncharacterized protein n=1 Tax=Phytophthora rubi TaxID=129364 RepID=A0A6A3L8V4_9STRA|nr:hypothetical protein PR002_g14782 [Phytophthora rubi]